MGGADDGRAHLPLADCRSARPPPRRPYQLEGNASGTITACDPPAHLEATWEYDGEVSWIAVRLAVDGDGTELRLVHTAHVDDARWDEFGPGAVGIGWDLSLLGLAQHLAAGLSPSPRRTSVSEEGRGLIHAPGGEAWCRRRSSGSPPGGPRRRRPETAFVHRRAESGWTVHAFDVLGDPVRRRILELLADGRADLGCRSPVRCGASSASRNLR